MEFIVDWNCVCLVCLQEGDMRSIYEKDEKDLSLCEKIMHCSSIQIRSGMNLPEQICYNCIDDLNAAYRFRTNCESSNVILKSFVNSQVSDLEIPAGNGQVYKYKPPSGLHVKRIKFPRLVEIKEECPVNIDINNYDDSNYMNNDDIINDNEVFNVKDDDDRLSASLETQDSDEEEIKTENDQAKEENCEMIEEHLVENEENKKEERVLKQNAGRRGRPKKKNLDENLETDVTSDNVSALMENLTTVTYVRKLREDEKPLKICEICGNGYKYQHALDSHMRRHRNEKPFSCEFCSRAFVANVELRRHMRVHTGQKPYPCRYCSRRFSDFGSRIKHERTHTGERPYECSTCGKSFAYAHVLSVHILTHTGEKKFKCEICGKGFTKKIYLKAHMNHHNNVVPKVENEELQQFQNKIIPQVQESHNQEEIDQNSVKIRIVPKLEDEENEESLSYEEFKISFVKQDN